MTLNIFKYVLPGTRIRYCIESVHKYYIQIGKYANYE